MTELGRACSTVGGKVCERVECTRNGTSRLCRATVLGKCFERVCGRTRGDGLREDRLEEALSGFILKGNRGHLVCFGFCRLIIHDIDVFA